MKLGSSLTQGTTKEIIGLKTTVNQSVLNIDVDVDWRGFGGRDLIPTHRKSS
jgi:hypothetical protein